MRCIRLLMRRDVILDRTGSSTLHTVTSDPDIRMFKVRSSYEIPILEDITSHVLLLMPVHGLQYWIAI